jgi:hypothetical protein
MFGLIYKSANRKSDAIIKASQGVLSQVQMIGCQEIIPQMIYNIKNTPNDPRIKSPSEVKLGMSKDLINMTKRLPGASKTNLNNSLTKLVNVVVDQSTVKGKIDQALARRNMVDVLSSFCPGKMMGKYNGPKKNVSVPGKKGGTLQKEIKIVDFPKNLVIEPNDFQTNNVTLDISNKYTISYKFMIDISGKVDPGTSVEIKISNDKHYSNVLLKGSDLKTGINTFTHRTPELEGKLDVKININPKGTNKITIIGGSHVTVSPVNSVVNAVKSTFGSMSNFGSSGSGFMTFLLLLLIVAGVLYYLYSQGKLKFPTMGQRVAQFGRDIKSIRGIRARR